MIERAEERASEREEKMRRLELEMEEKMREREERREMQMLSMFSAIMGGSASGFPFFQPSTFHPTTVDRPPPMPPMPPMPPQSTQSIPDTYNPPPESPRPN